MGNRWVSRIKPRNRWVSWIQELESHRVNTYDALDFGGESCIVIRIGEKSMNGIVGPHVRKLEQVVSDAASISLHVAFHKPEKKTVTLDITSTHHGIWCNLETPKGNGYEILCDHLPRIQDCFQQVYAQGQHVIDIDLDRLSVKSSKSPVKGKALKTLCIDALYEFYGFKKPSVEEIEARQRAQQKARRLEQAERRKARTELLALLAGGEVEKWNQRHSQAAELGPFKKTDLHGLALPGIKLVDMPEADFTGCDLTGALINRCNLDKARFNDARLSNARIENSRFKNADLSGVDLSGATLYQLDLRGTRLVNVDLDGARFKSCLHDDSTDWSGTARPTEGLLWRGKGPDPVQLEAIDSRKKTEGPVDMETFMRRLHENIDPGRVKKALKMLKQDAFQLYVDAGDDGLIGVVKSQKDPDLVYSCRLHSSGAFACCTQNLNPCGGLRGALCKHLMVLLIGLANANEIDPDTLDGWVQRSLLQQPQLDKEAMSSILLKYKGADAGEIDWRPTETVPEDFYAF